MRRNPIKSGVVRILVIVIVAFAATLLNLEESVGQVTETFNTFAGLDKSAQSPIDKHTSTSLNVNLIPLVPLLPTEIIQTPVATRINSFDIFPTEKITLSQMPTDLPSATPTFTYTMEVSPTASSTQAPITTDLPTATATQTNTSEPSPTASSTQAPTATDLPTATSTQTNTPKPSPAASSTQAPAATDTPSAEPSATASFTQAPTATNSPTSTFTDTPSPVPSATASFTLTPTATDSPTSTSTKTSSPSPTLEPSPSPTSLPDKFPQWSKVEITFTGPDSVGMSDVANPFQILMDVTFIGPGGQIFVVPAFYDGDGEGGLDGNVWKVRFSPDEVGNWSFSTSSSNALLNGLTGSFAVTAPTGCQAYNPGALPDFLCLGRLEYAGAHYLKFDDGPYWLKGGEDDPEDFLAPGITVGFSTKEQAIDFLASKGINSLYMMLHNINGDGNNVWPWVGSNAAEAKANHEHFNVIKLGEWEDLFSYLQEQGLVLHLVLEDDSAWTGFNRSMYYREMIARFSHHNGVIWNISEEYNENYTSDQVRNFAQMIRDLDPYDHPITVHHAGGLSAWDTFVGDPRFDLTSFQTSASPQNVAAKTWFETVESSGRTIPISFDETGKLGAGDRDLTRHIVWSIYLGGSNFEMHTYPLPGYLDFASHFEDMTRARAFLESLPFWQMSPMNELLVSGQGYIFGKAGNEYAIYLPNGGSIEINLSGASGNLQMVWFNPRTGEYTGQTTITGGGIQVFTTPFSGDAVLSISSE